MPPATKPRPLGAPISKFSKSPPPQFATHLKDESETPKPERRQSAGPRRQLSDANTLRSRFSVRKARTDKSEDDEGTPLVRIDVIKRVRSPEQLRRLADCVQNVLHQYFHLSPHRRRQIITQHEPYEMLCHNGAEVGSSRRSTQLIVVQIFHHGLVNSTQQLHKTLADVLERECGLSGQDLVVSCIAGEVWR